MKWAAVLTMVLAAAQAGAQQNPAQKPAAGEVLKTDKAKESYAVGVQVGTSLKQQGADVDLDALVRGLKDALSGQKLLMNDSDLRNMLSRFISEARLKQAASAREEGPKNQKAGDAFLAANRAKPGVVVLPDGLQYKVIKMGEGKKPTDSDTVTVNYRGTLIDGTEFDSSYKRGEPATFPVTGVIKGWTEALKLMPVGSKWQLFIPAQLAYGVRGAPPVIGPNATLVFEVELLSIK